MILGLIAYFVVGIVLDVFFTIWFCGISDKNIKTAMIGSFLTTICSYTLLYYLILSPSFIANLFAYSSGCAFGTGLVVWYKNKMSVFHNRKDIHD